MSSIHFITNDLFQLQVEALVNTVNTVGVMGKGIALQFKTLFPLNYKIYKKEAEQGNLQIGKLLITNVNEPISYPHLKWIINFPTKIHWRGNSEFRFIKEGLKALREEIENKQIQSIALPALGAGNGGLDWQQVKELIKAELNNLNCEIFVCEPVANTENLVALPNIIADKKPSLTPSRVLLLYLLNHLENMGGDTNEVAAVKLAYFLKKLQLGDFQKLQFHKYYYGPYAHEIAKVLNYLNGFYLHKELINSKPFDEIKLNSEEIANINLSDYLSEEELKKLVSLKKLIDGFESSFALELLASIDLILTQNDQASFEEVAEEICKWSSRKQKIFSKPQILIAYNHLKAQLYQ